MVKRKGLFDFILFYLDRKNKGETREDKVGKKFLMIVTLLVIVSYLINFVWESFHSVFLYNLPNFSLKEFVLLINHVSSVDAIMILLVYLITALLWKDLIWIERLNKSKIIAFIGICLTFALWVEYRGVFLLKKWSYSYLMPTIFGFGLSPLIQLFITGLIAIYSVKLLICQEFYVKMH